MMSQKKKHQNSVSASSRPRRHRGRSRRKYHLLDVGIGVAIICGAVLLAAWGVYTFFREDGENTSPAPIPLLAASEISALSPPEPPKEKEISFTEPFADTPDDPVPSLTDGELAALAADAEAGDAGACFLLGRYYYYDGNGKNYSRAADFFEKGAELGDARAEYQAGLCYERGDGVKKDPVKALNYFKGAAEKGLIEAQYHLAECYDFGYGSQKDTDKADYWFRKAAEAGGDKRSASC